MWTTVFFAVAFLFAALSPQTRAIDLLAKYPTSLTDGDTTHPRDWKFGSEDIFAISSFKFEVADQLRINLGPSDVGIGHCDDGAVWAIIMPRTRSGLTTQITNIVEPVAHVWLRFHPSQLNELFPPESVSAGSALELAPEIGVIAKMKIRSSWQGNGRALIPPPNTFTVDIETWTGIRRFFGVEKTQGKADYVGAFETQIVKRPPAITRELARDCFDKIWSAFDEQYAMFALRPEVDWNALRSEFRMRAIDSKSTYAFANVIAEMLRPLRDLHIWLTVAGADIPVFDRPRFANANPAALRSLLPALQQAGRDIQWAITEDKIGFILIRGWNDRDLPGAFDKLLEQFRDTLALVLDVRLNAGGSETLAREVAGRFVDKEFTYASSQFRSGPKHTDLGEKQPRRVSPRGPWRYNRPVLLLIGERCMSSNESFIAMMTGDHEVITMGDHTAGSSGNPKIVQLPLGMSVSVPQWIDYLPDGTPLDERGIEPKIRFTPAPSDFEGSHDQLLSEALDRARKFSLPTGPIPGPVFIPDDELPRGLRPARLVDYSQRIKSESTDQSRPHVIEVSPADGAENVSADTELRIRFDRPMNALAMHLDWLTGGFLECGDTKYDSNRFEFTIPVRLPPSATHQIVVNKNFWGDQPMIVRPLDGFLSTNLERAAVFVWKFETAGSRTNDAKRPRAVRIDPPNGSRTRSFQFIEVEFDRDMILPESAFPYLLRHSRDTDLPPELISKIEYDERRRTFRIPMAFSPKQKPSFVLAGFRSVEGAPAEPMKIEYQSVENAVADLPANAKDQRLIQLLAAMREKRAILTSVVEHVQTITMYQEDGLFTRLEAKDSEFRWQTPGQFYSDVSAMMGFGKTYRIGCDGTNWWQLNRIPRTNILAFRPTLEMQEANVSICDPFDLLHSASDEIIASFHLTYAGLQSTGEKQCHKIEAWRVEPIPDFQPSVSHLTWLIDSKTLRVSEVIERYASSVMRTKFIVESLNQPIDPDFFAPPLVSDLQLIRSEPPNVGLTNFINLKDGSDGHMTVRWGRKGLTEGSSSGLN